MPIKIDQYEIAWHPQQRGIIKLKLANNTVQTLKINDAAEFNAIATILNEDPAFFSNGWIHSGPEPTGGS
ncbi:MAG: hypothetical protein JNM06_05100 [Blastocatellia bacterium]|nr:hypothetical protein [Blastocatellia bacterium]